MLLFYSLSLPLHFLLLLIHSPEQTVRFIFCLLAFAKPVDIAYVKVSEKKYDRNCQENAYENWHMKKKNGEKKSRHSEKFTQNFHRIGSAKAG